MKGSRTMVVLGVVCCCLALVALASGEEKAVINSISKDETKSEKEEVEFNCTVQNPANYPILWYKLDKNGSLGLLLSSTGNLIISDSRFSVKYNNVTSTVYLKIRDLKQSDGGTYQCQIQTDSRKIANDVVLRMTRPPKINSNVTTVYNVTENSAFELRCNADGFPIPSISWRREDDLLLSIGGSIYRGDVLKIPRAYRDDRGVYYCIAENTVGPEDRLNITVNVDFAPVVTAIKPRVGQHPGYDVRLECKIEARPAPVVSWYYKDQPLRKEQSTPSGDEFVDTLVIYGVSSSNYGLYTCKAENKYGHAQTEIEVFETVVPVCVNYCG